MSKKVFLSGFVGFVLGGLVGAGVALFNAPQSGEKTRALMRDKSTELKEKARDRYEETRSSATEFVEELRTEMRSRASKWMPAKPQTADESPVLIEEGTNATEKAVVS